MSEPLLRHKKIALLHSMLPRCDLMCIQECHWGSGALIGHVPGFDQYLSQHVDRKRPSVPNFGCP